MTGPRRRRRSKKPAKWHEPENWRIGREALEADKRLFEQLQADKRLLEHWQQARASKRQRDADVQELLQFVHENPLARAARTAEEAAARVVEEALARIRRSSRAKIPPAAPRTRLTKRQTEFNDKVERSREFLRRCHIEVDDCTASLLGEKLGYPERTAHRILTALGKRRR